MKTTLPTLTLAGFTNHPQTMLIKLYEYFLTSNYSQSVSYYGSITSLGYLIKENGDDIEQLKSDIRETFTDLLEKYLSKSDLVLNEIDVMVHAKQGVNTNDVVISMDATIVMSGQSYNMIQEINLDKTSLLNKSEQLKYLLNGE